jgi:hypothetical protein
LYPDHKILVQVALSQLIEVPEDHPERMSIRNRFSQLVADFVLCRSDLSVVAVIELDDRSHESAVSQGADARKNKALADAGIRLVRIPAGTLPSEDTLRGLVDAEGICGEVAREETVLRLAETVETYSGATPIASRRDHSSAESRELKRIALKAIVGAIVLVGGWFIYSQYLPSALQRALQPLAVPHVARSSVVPRAAVVFGPPAEVVADSNRTELQTAAALQKQENLAWGRSYSAPASCEHPVDWNAQVACGNQFMRAKKEFEQRWTDAHSSGGGTGGVVVLDNAAIGGAQRH